MRIRPAVYSLTLHPSRHSIWDSYVLSPVPSVFGIHVRISAEPFQCEKFVFPLGKFSCPLSSSSPLRRARAGVGGVDECPGLPCSFSCDSPQATPPVLRPRSATLRSQLSAQSFISVFRSFPFSLGWFLSILVPKFLFCG